MVTVKEFRKWREASGYTQSSFAKTAGIAPNSVNAFENGRTKHPYWLKLPKVKKLLTSATPEATVNTKTEKTADGQTLLTTLVESKPVLGALMLHMTAAEIAGMAGTTVRTVELWAKEHGIEKRAAKKITAKQLAKDFGV